MTLNEFLTESTFSKQKELRRVLLIAFFNLRVQNTAAFTAKDASDWLVKLGYGRPNPSRLTNNLSKSKMFVSSGSKGRYKIHPTAIEALDSEFPKVKQKSEDIISLDSILAETLLTKDRTFIKLLIRQINSSYENNIFDGCAVLMRRLLEVLLVLAYEELKLDADIRDGNGNYKQLNNIIDNAQNNKPLALSRNSKEALEVFRKVGNFSAHKIYYNANRKTVEEIILDYRATVEELLYKSGLRT